MSTVNLEIEIPERIRGTDLERKLLQKAHKHALEQAVLELYKEGSISTGTGAELLQMPLYDFIQFLGRHHVALFNQTPEELDQDVPICKCGARRDTGSLIGRRPQLFASYRAFHRQFVGLASLIDLGREACKGRCSSARSSHYRDARRAHRR